MQTATTDHLVEKQEGKGEEDEKQAVLRRPLALPVGIDRLMETHAEGGRRQLGKSYFFHAADAPDLGIAAAEVRRRPACRKAFV